MTITTIHPAGTRRHYADALADLRTAHLDAAQIVADVDLDDTELWREVDGFVADITAAAYRLTAETSGDPPVSTAARARPVARVRELATAQRRLFGTLDRHPAPSPELLAESADQVRMFGRAVRRVARSPQQ